MLLITLINDLSNYQKGEQIATSLLFDKQRFEGDLGDIGKGRFTRTERIVIADLSPRQSLVEIDVLRAKMKGIGLTKPYVVIGKGFKVLIDGHHTVIAKKLNGQQFVIAKTYYI